MKKFLISMLNALWHFVQLLFKIAHKFFKKNPEFITVPAACLVWTLSIPLLRLADPSAAVFDAGVFQILIFAIIGLFTFLAISWWLMRVLFGTHYKYIRYDFKKEFNFLDKWQKIKLSYTLFFALVFALILLSHTLIAGRL